MPKQKKRRLADYSTSEMVKLCGMKASSHLEGKSAISNYENNSRGVSAEMLTQLSVLFHVSAD